MMKYWPGIIWAASSAYVHTVYVPIARPVSRIIHIRYCLFHLLNPASLQLMCPRSSGVSEPYPEIVEERVRSCRWTYVCACLCIHFDNLFSCCRTSPIGRFSHRAQLWPSIGNQDFGSLKAFLTISWCWTSNVSKITVWRISFSLFVCLVSFSLKHTHTHISGELRHVQGKRRNSEIILLSVHAILSISKVDLLMLTPMVVCLYLSLCACTFPLTLVIVHTAELEFVTERNRGCSLII